MEGHKEEMETGVINVHMRAEQITGTRYCKACDCILPLDQFTPGKKRHLCSTHMKKQKKELYYNTKDQKALSSFQSRYYHDLHVFGQEKLVLSKRDIVNVWTEEQITNHAKWCIVPKHPDKMMTKDNFAFVTSDQRKYLVSNWKFKKDVNEYINELKLFIEK